MAQAFFNTFNKNKEYEAISAGTTIADSINPECHKVMEEIGINMPKEIFYPKKITTEMIKTTSKTYSMGCDVACNLPNVKLEGDLKIDDPKGKCIEEVRKIRNKVKEQVMIVLNNLS